jgi:hypothetical protein
MDLELRDTRVGVNLRNLALIQMRKPVALNCGVAAYLFSQLLDLKLTSRIGMTKE